MSTKERLAEIVITTILISHQRSLSQKEASRCIARGSKAVRKAAQSCLKSGTAGKQSQTLFPRALQNQAWHPEESQAVLGKGQEKNLKSLGKDMLLGKSTKPLAKGKAKFKKKIQSAAEQDSDPKEAAAIQHFSFTFPSRLFPKTFRNSHSVKCGTPWLRGHAAPATGLQPCQLALQDGSPDPPPPPQEDPEKEAQEAEKKGRKGRDAATAAVESLEEALGKAKKKLSPKGRSTAWASWSSSGAASCS